MKGREATLIKMDIEGTEMEALEGAEKTITKWRPDMAISVYHKPEDIYEILAYILRLVPQYDVYLRHYMLGKAETVAFFIYNK